MRYIGDIHGKLREYEAIIEGCEESVQVGDFGYGFLDIPKYSINHRFIRGNHDSPALCKESPNWIADGKILGDTMYIGGAYSIDQDHRIPGVSWWDDEELSHYELLNVLDIYCHHEPKVVVSHECPDWFAMGILNGHPSFPSRTRQMFNVMWESHKPTTWIFGHWHRSIDITVDGCRFICLNELEYIDL